MLDDSSEADGQCPMILFQQMTWMQQTANAEGLSQCEH
jgi:hypothetical protein